MNIAITIIVGLAMVARAHSLDCFKCQEVNLVSGAQNSCTSDSIGQCSGAQVCSTLTIKFIISANGKPMDNYMKQRKCLPMTAKDKELSKCGNLESQFEELYGAQGFRNYGCEIEFCEDDLCNSDSYTSAVCVEDGDDGSSYRGDVAVTESGRVCQRWDSQLPNEHNLTPEENPNEGLNHNYCRNPDGEPGPWCYNAEGTFPRWEYCDVPRCGD